MKSDTKPTINHPARWIKPTCCHIFQDPSASSSMVCHRNSLLFLFLSLSLDRTKKFPYFCPIKSNKYYAFRFALHIFPIDGFSWKISGQRFPLVLKKCSSKTAATTNRPGIQISFRYFPSQILVHANLFANKNERMNFFFFEVFPAKQIDSLSALQVAN